MFLTFRSADPDMCRSARKIWAIRRYECLLRHGCELLRPDHVQFDHCQRGAGSVCSREQVNGVVLRRLICAQPRRHDSETPIHALRTLAAVSSLFGRFSDASAAQGAGN